jgi:hypothetical protein
MAQVKMCNSKRGKDWLYEISGKEGTGRASLQWTAAADLCAIETSWASKSKKRQTALDFVKSWLALHEGRGLATEF